LFCLEFAFGPDLCAGSITDTFFVAFRIPNLLRNLVAEEPLLRLCTGFRIRTKGRSVGAQKTMSSVLSLLLAATVLISIVGIVFAP